MTTTEVPADYQSSACPLWANGASCHAQLATEVLPSRRFAQAEAFVRGWTKELDEVREELARVQRRIAEAIAELSALGVEATQRSSQLLTIYSRRRRLELRLNAARLAEFTLLVRMRHLEALQEQQHANRATQSWQAVGYGLVSPAMGVWQRLLYEVLDVPTQLALAEELVELGILFDAQDEFIPEATDYRLSSMARQIARDFFFEEIAEPFVQDSLKARARAAAETRQLENRRSRERTFETGSAAAIAKRMHPLGAPPKSA